MLRTTLVRLNHAYKPMMRFPDRKAAKESHEPKPHPDAPKDIAENFDHYKKLHDTGPHFNPDKLEQQNASQGESQASEEASNLFDLPPRFWNTPSLRWSPAEMEAVIVRGLLTQSGGSSVFDK